MIMNAELVNKDTAYKKYLELKDLAFSIAQVNGTLPGYCNAPECRLFMALAGLASELKLGEVCIFVNDAPAEQLTDMEVGPGKFFIGKICAQNVREAKIDNDTLKIYYHDGMIETYTFIETLNAWKFNSRNSEINVPSTSAN